MLKMHIYNKALNGQIHQCAVCTLSGATIQHHVAGRRYDDRAIWVHHECHQKIHDPAAFGLPIGWAYDNYYLLRRSSMEKEPKKKGCTHSKSYFDRNLGYIKCQYCGKPVDSVNFGAGKTKKVQSGDANKERKKMGYEAKQPAHIIKAANLKANYDSLRTLAKRSRDPIKAKEYLDEAQTIRRKMKAHALEFGLE